MRKTEILLVILLAVVIIGFCACQPTPENEIVIPRENTEQEVIKSAEENQSIETIAFEYEVPEHITDRYPIVEGSVDMVIDADVYMLDLDSVPVAKIVSEPFTQQRADELREYFMGDGRLVSRWVPTKSDYDEWIIEAQRGELIDGEYVYTEDTEQWIQQLIKERENAPDDDIQNLITDYSIYGEYGLMGRIIVDGKEKGTLRASENEFGFSASDLYKSATRANYDEMTGELIEMPQREFDYTESQAKDVALSLFSDLGIEGMEVVESEKIYYIEGYDKSDEIICGGYRLEYMREYGGMLPFKTGGFSLGPNNDYDVMPPVDKEWIMVCINEYGEITNFFWSDPIRIVETLTEHVDILPFEDIMDRLEETSKIRFAYMGDYPTDMLMMKSIFEIRFCLNYLPIKNNPTEYMYAPCWVFKYKDWWEYSEEQKKELEEMGGHMPNWDEMGEELIVFSAVDGASVSVYSQKMYEGMIASMPGTTGLQED